MKIVKVSDRQISLHLLQYSMKSDSGGEMESCRSSDSESGGGGGGVLHDSTRGSGTSGSSPSPSADSSSSSSNMVGVMADSLAEKEAELLKVKMECRRLQEANANLTAKLRTGQTRTAAPASDLEKEVDHLRLAILRH